MTPESSTWSAPGRVTLLGDHTDHDGGLALPFAVPQRTRAQVSRGGGAGLRVRSAGYDGVVEVASDDEPGETRGWGRYVAAAAWALRTDGVRLPPVEVSVRSDVPAGAGLSSSHALLVAVASALLDVAGAQRSPAELGVLVQRAEHDYVGTPSGLLDQTALLHATESHLLLVDAGGEAGGGTPTVEQVPCDLTTGDLCLLVVDCRAPHALTDGAYAALREDVARAATALGVPTLRSLLDAVGLGESLDRLEAATAGDGSAGRRGRHVLTENARVREAAALCRAGRVGELGPLMTASQASQREDLRNSVPAVDLAAATLLEAGALGARMTGGGFGGSVVALVPRDGVPRCADDLERAHTRAGLPIPVPTVVRPSAGVRRESG